MAEDGKMKTEIEIVPKVDEKKAEQEGKKITKGVKKSIGGNGYIKLKADIDYNYPKQTTAKSGLTRGVNYSKLQKAQDELISNWNKLSKKGFYSDEEKVFEVLKSYRTYMGAVKHQYGGNVRKEEEDERLSAIRSTIGTQIFKYFTRVMGNVPLGSGKNGMFTGAETNFLFEQYAKEAIKKVKAAQMANIDLSKDEALTKIEKSKIQESLLELEKEEKIKSITEQRKYEKEHADEIKKAQNEQLAQIAKTRAEEDTKAIPIPKRDIENVELTATKVVNLGEPTDYKQTEQDKQFDKDFIRSLSRDSKSRSQNSPDGEHEDAEYNRGSDNIPLGYRQQAWNPFSLDEDTLVKLFHDMERGGTYVGENALLRSTMQALPEEIRKSIASLVSSIDKDEAAKVFNTFDKSTRAEFAKLASELNMSKQLLVNVAKVQGGLMAGREDTTSEDLKNAIWVALADMMEHGNSQIDFENFKTAIIKIVNMLTNRYSNMKDKMGTTISRRKKINGEYVDEKELGVGINYKQVEATLKEVFQDIGETADILQRAAIKAFPDFYNEGKTKSGKKGKRGSTFTQDYNEKLNSLVGSLRGYLGELVDGLSSLQHINDLTKEQNNLTKKQTQLDTIEYDREHVADDTLKSIEETDANDGSNSEENFKELIDSVKDILNEISNLEPPHNERIDVGNNLPDLYRSFEDGMWKTAEAVDHTDEVMKEFMNNGKRIMQLPSQEQYNKAHQKRIESDIERELELIEQGKHPSQQRSNKFKDRSQVETTIKDYSKKFPPNYEKIIAATSREQDKMSAELIKRYGIGADSSTDAMGDKLKFARRASLWGKSNPLNEMFKNFKLTPGIKIDTTEITSAIADVLSGPEMFKAQSGGWLNNLAIIATGGFASRFQPSLEKTRAQADVINTAMSELRNNINSVIQTILDKESKLSGMEETGDVVFGEDGNVIFSTDEAGIEIAELEKAKVLLASLLADVGMVKEVVDATGGSFNGIIKNLGFTSPMLRKINIQLANVNAGLDKNGKALKFQRRDQEILNYSFQLMGRHLGQTLKRWMLMLNPINLIKKAFSDFASYDVKWQRTMNVIKYNIRRIIKPFMEWLAQQLVNIIGLGNALIKGIGKVFGYDWDLFDQTAANTEKMAEEIQNVSAGFDELHDIGSDNTGANDLLGDIYKPQWTDLYKDVEAFGENVANVFKGIGDFFSELDFWGWLKLAGGALVGFLALKTLIEWFHKGKNPLQTVANGFSFLEKAVGWSALILSFGAFVKILGEFIDLVGNMEPEQIDLALGALGRGLLELGGAIAGIEILEKLLGLNWKSLLGEAGIIASFALLTDKLKDFISTVGEMENKKVAKAMETLGDALAGTGFIIIGLLVALAAIAATGFGDLAIIGLVAIIAAIALVIDAYANFANATANLVEVIAKHKDEIIEIMESAGNIVQKIFLTVGTIVVAVIKTIGTVIENIIDKIITKIAELITIVVTGIGGTIKDIIQTVGNVIIGVIEAITDAIPKLLNSILNFCWQIGPAIENSISAIIRGVTKLINFIISAVEYMINTLLIGSINGLLSKIPFIGGALQIGPVNIPRFYPQYEQGTNYVPNDGLAYLHQGEAVVPKKYNQPYNQGLSNEEKAYMQQMMTTMRSLDGTLKQGIPVSGQFVQRGSDLVAVVNKTKSQIGADLLSNVSYAR